MRKIIISIFICLLAGCSELYDESLGLFPTLIPRYLSITLNSLTFTSSKGEKAIGVTSMETPWIFENNIDWISISPKSGNISQYITVGVSENKIGDEIRTGLFYLKADVNDWNYEMPISVTQAGAKPFITPSQKEIEISGGEHSETIIISSNCSWNAVSSVEWLSVTEAESSITLSVSTNETNVYRTAKIDVYHTGSVSIKETITVRQAPASINASTETLVFYNRAGSMDITISSEANWTASSSNSWIEITPTTGSAGTSTMTISVSPNTSIVERRGYVILSIGSNERIQIPIHQRGIFIETEQSELTFSASRGILDLSVISNTSWEVSSVPSWITVSPNKGDGDGCIKVTANENPNTANRTGVIQLTQSGLNLNVNVTVNQSGKTFDIGTTVLNFEDKEETQTIEISTDGTWSAHTNENWISLSPTSASGNSTLSVSVSENPNADERNGQVMVSMGDAYFTVDVVQKGKYFTVSNNLLTYTSKGGVLSVAITTNDKWTGRIENSPSWIELSTTSGYGDIEVMVTAKDNPSVNSRSATLIFKTVHHQSIRIVVTQEPRFLKIDTQEVLFYSKGGTSESITVSTDGTYDISCSDEWFYINQSENEFTVTASENTTTEPRIGHITIALNDLTEGSYSLKFTVTQLNNGGTFLRKDYGEDTNFDDTGNTIGNLNIRDFGADNNYDSTTSSGTKLSITKFKTDTNLDSKITSNLVVNISGYKSDTNLDSSTTSSGNISKTGFESDTNWQ